jgi:hypothetical protein
LEKTPEILIFLVCEKHTLKLDFFMVKIAIFRCQNSHFPITNQKHPFFYQNRSKPHFPYQKHPFFPSKHRFSYYKSTQNVFLSTWDSLTAPFWPKKEPETSMCASPGW